MTTVSDAPDLTALDGAVVDEHGVLLHVGDPMREQRLLASGAAIAPLGDRRVISVAGADRLSWLDSLTSQALARLQPGESAELLVLDPQGHVEHAAALVDDGACAWLIVDAASAEALAAWLTRMRFRLRVEPALRPELLVVGGTVDALATVDAAARWVDPWPEVTAGGWGYANIDPHPAAGRDWSEAIVGADTLDALIADAAGGVRTLAGVLAVDALRVAAWRPRVAAEGTAAPLPHEVDWLRTAVHLDKGCYRGQETVAKVHNLGHPPRRLVAVHLDGSDDILPAPGAPVVADGAEVGVLTSVARHFEDGPIGLALLKRNAPLGGAFVVRTDDGDVAASAEVIVPPDAGRTASVPRLPRLSRRR